MPSDDRCMQVLMTRYSPAIAALFALACVAACGSSNDDTEEVVARNASEPPSTGSESANESSPGLPEGSDVPSFAADISPILQTNCGSCHGTGSLPRFAGTDVNASYTVAVRLSGRINTRLAQGSMPPSCGRKPPGTSGCISADGYATIQRWVEGGTPE